MGDISERIRHRESLNKIMTAEEAALLFRTGIGPSGGEKLRASINRGEVKFIEGKGGQLPLQVKRGWYGPVDLAVIEAVGLTQDGHILPSTAVYDSPEWMDCAKEVIVEINLNRPMALQGLHD